ncbi:MAG: hypothetical protein AB7S26_24285 [Sandaracinaceae bacterium]
MASLDATYDVLLRYAREEIRAHQTERGEAIARQALSLEPHRAAAYNVLAVVRELQGHHPEAMDLLRAGIAVEPTYKPAQQNLERLGSFPQRGAFLLGDEEDESKQ